SDAAKTLKEENQQIKSSDEPPIDYNEFYEQVWPLLVERVPSFRTAKVINAWHSYEDVNMFDEAPIIGEHLVHENFIQVCGLGGYGPQMSIAIGKALSEKFYDRAYVTVNLRKFDMRRIMHGSRCKELKKKMIRRRKIQVKPNQCLSKPKNNEEENEDKNKRSKGGEELSTATTTAAATVETTTIIPIIYTSSNPQTNTTTEIVVPQLSQEEDQLNRQQNCEGTNNNHNNTHNIVSTTSSLETIIVRVTSSDYSHGINTFVNVNSNINVLQAPESFDRNVPESVVHEKQISNNRIHLPPLLSSSRTSQQQQNTYSTSYCNLSENYGSPQKLDKSDSTLSEKRFRERPKEKLCDTKKFTMADLVKWRPKTENTFRKKWSTKRKNDEEEKASILSKTDESADDLSTSKSLTPKKGVNIDEEKEEKPPTSGPRVRINEQGEMVVDEDSLIVMQNPENVQLETVINNVNFN
uniref:FAD dependent oxidoreductase domain-containing protein n=1 Tax=Meloidogyne floridensis TaxID=298350 RepID=A0A915NRL3_9BILA